MTETSSNTSHPAAATKSVPTQRNLGKVTSMVFTGLIRLVFILAILGVLYWLVFASDRYVSESTLIIRKTDSVSAPAFDLGLLFTGALGAERSNQMLLRENLLSVDMLKTLDQDLDLRTHYSDSEHDFVSRMWFQDSSMEWFHQHYLDRVEVVYDDFAGVLRLKVQAYSPQMAHDIAQMLVNEGERYMNDLGHDLANAQVKFLTEQVQHAQQRFIQARQTLLNHQNQEGLFSPQASVESISTIIATLEARRAQLQTQLASLPKTLDQNHPNIMTLKQALAAVDQQIREERVKLANPEGETLNVQMDEFLKLEMEVSFAKELYQSSLIALEKGRIDASRMLEKVSVLQAPTFPQYPMQPRRIYNTILTLLLALMLAGILKLLESIIKDHVD